MIELVVARSSNGVIGRDGDLPWRLPTDLKHFKEITTGGSATVVMGRKTWESLPESFRPLPGRRNIVLSSNPGFGAEGAEVMASLGEAVEASGGECFVIGGGATYEEALPLAGVVHVTEVRAEVEGDTFFPALDPAEWIAFDESEPVSENGYEFTFQTWKRPVLYDLSASRSDEQREYMVGLERDGICIFCPENVGEYHAPPIEFEREHWYVTRNKWPYKGTLDHFLIVPRRHVTSFDELPDEAGAELWSIKRQLKDTAVEGGKAFATVERSDRMQCNGGSVAHMHVHFVVLGDEPEKTVKFRVSARAEPGD